MAASAHDRDRPPPPSAYPHLVPAPAGFTAFVRRVLGRLSASRCLPILHRPGAGVGRLLVVRAVLVGRAYIPNGVERSEKVASARGGASDFFILAALN